METRKEWDIEDMGITASAGAGQSQCTYGSESWGPRTPAVRGISGLELISTYLGRIKTDLSEGGKTEAQRLNTFHQLGKNPTSLCSFLAQFVQPFPRCRKGGGTSAGTHVRACRCIPPMTYVSCTATWVSNTHQIWSRSAEPSEL